MVIRSYQFSRNWIHGLSLSYWMRHTRFCDNCWWTNSPRKCGVQPRDVYTNNPQNVLEAYDYIPWKNLSTGIYIDAVDAPRDVFFVFIFGNMRTSSMKWFPNPNAANDAMERHVLDTWSHATMKLRSGVDYTTAESDHTMSILKQTNINRILIKRMGSTCT